MGEVIQLDVPTKADLDVDAVLDGAHAAGLDNVFIVGELPSGKLYIAASSGDVPLNGWLLDQAKIQMLRISEPDADED